MPLTGLATGARGYGMFGVTAPSSAYDSIATVTPSAGAASITFSSIPQTYTSLQIRGIYRDSDSGSGIIGGIIRLNGVSTNSYAQHQVRGDGSAASAVGNANVNYMELFQGPRNGSLSSSFGALIVDIHDYANSTRNKTLRSFAGTDLNGSGLAVIGSGLYVATDAITSITMVAGWSGFASGTTFALYGIRGA